MPLWHAAPWGVTSIRTVSKSQSRPALRTDWRLPELAPVYSALAAASLPLAAARGVAPGQIAAMKELLDQYAHGAVAAPHREGHRP